MNLHTEPLESNLVKVVSLFYYFHKRLSTYCLFPVVFRRFLLFSCIKDAFSFQKNLPTVVNRCDVHTGAKWWVCQEGQEREKAEEGLHSSSI